MRRRPAGAGGKSGASPRGNVIEDRDAAGESVSAFTSELWARLGAFVRELRMNETKPWGDFFAHFKPPRAWTMQVLDERVTTNFLHYRGNYSIIVVGLMLLGIISNPSVLLAVACCVMLVVYLLPHGKEDRPVVLFEHTLQKKERLAGAVIGVPCILSLSGAWYILVYYVGSGVLLCTLHCVFRPRSLSSKATRTAREVNNAASSFSIEGAQNFVERVLNSSRSQ
eukprot:jgi/Undpi1/1339/HiC_scaffold_11.g04731.m1